MVGKLFIEFLDKEKKSTKIPPNFQLQTMLKCFRAFLSELYFNWPHTFVVLYRLNRFTKHDLYVLLLHKHYVNVLRLYKHDVNVLLLH